MSEKVSSTALNLNRLKRASEAYQEYKKIQLEYEGTGVDPDTGINEGDHMAEGTQTWPEFRDQFLADWNNNRRIVDEKEADVIFDNLADEAMNELDSGTTVVDVATVVDAVETAEVAGSDEVALAPVASVDKSEETSLIPEVLAAPKRRGRPPGSGKKAAAAVVTKTEKVKQPKAVRKVKVKAKAKTKVSSGSKGQAIVEKYGPSGRKWARKDVIEKLVAAGISSGYAPTVYQKYA